MPSNRRLPPILWLILALALALRLFGAWRGNLIFDERAHLALAETIDLRPGHVHLVSRTLDHPLLSIYHLLDERRRVPALPRPVRKEKSEEGRSRG